MYRLTVDMAESGLSFHMIHVNFHLAPSLALPIKSNVHYNSGCLDRQCTSLSNVEIWHINRPSRHRLNHQSIPNLPGDRTVRTKNKMRLLDKTHISMPSVQEAQAR
jgi:hypothetical protein